MIVLAHLLAARGWQRFGETEAASFEVIGTGRRFRTIPMSD